MHSLASVFISIGVFMWGWVWRGHRKKTNGGGGTTEHMNVKGDGGITENRIGQCSARGEPTRIKFS